MRHFKEGAAIITRIVCIAIVTTFFSCNNKEKEIVIENTANPKYDIGVWFEDEKNTSYTYVNDVYSLWPGDFGKPKNDSVKHTILKAFIVSKDSIVLSEFMERSYRDNVPRLTVFGNEINLNPYLRGITCEYIRFPKPYSYNDLIFYPLNIFGKGSDTRFYSQPLTLMVNIKTKECTVVGRCFYSYIEDQNMAIFDGKYFGILDFYMNSNEYICKYYDTLGNYVGWTPNVGLEYTQTRKKVVYTTPLKNINTDWGFTYGGNDKYKRPVSMKKGKEKYEVKYSDSGYHLTGYDSDGRKKYDFEPYDVNELFDLRTWDIKFKNRGKLTIYDTRQTSIIKNSEKYEVEYTATGYRLKGYDDKGRIKFEYENNNNSNFDLQYWDMKIPNRGKLIKYSYDFRGILDNKKYYNESQSYYMRESQRNDGRFTCDGIYMNAGEFSDDILIDVDVLSDMWTRNYAIYRIDPQTGIKSEITSLPKQDIKQYLLNYLYNLE